MDIRILIADDHIDSVNMVGRFLRTHGYTFFQAYSVGEAKRIAQENQCNLLLADLMFADGDGIDIWRSLQSHGPAEGIAITGSDDGPSVLRLRTAGFGAVIRKPLVFSDLLKQVEAAARRLGDVQ